jgi:hypothetical protein
MDTHTPPETHTSWWTAARKRAAICAAVALVAAVVGGVLVLRHGGSATASSGGNTAGQGFPGGAPPASGGSTDDSFDRFRQCLQQHGVSLPDRSHQGGRPNLDDSTTRKAFEACREYAPAPRDGFGGPPGSQNAPTPTPATPVEPDGSTL